MVYLVDVALPSTMYRLECYYYKLYSTYTEQAHALPHSMYVHSMYYVHCTQRLVQCRVSLASLRFGKVQKLCLLAKADTPMSLDHLQDALASALNVYLHAES